ncbi:hypothetical protein CLUG_02341 [Clavispora lusitaniae ATCC 42720]|uniref:Uncharacterized protein n=1 Tax=Clavispora lusitaniae (strain ATCC 42720) TaxID=306902 RepID=C4Y3W9_CLAL4|nr:uncharacterized protein CLUG_02341 [Clavispora lusitaniae ATCC 42720]EEQ38215.1 hypothetical protein CLUG_02341 [Clavispora lusitaniae ATCC 42720]
MNARSISFWRLVAPITIIWPFERRPSHKVMNSAFNNALTSWSAEERSLRKESISSMKMIHGCNLLAKEKIASTILLDSPYHLSMTVSIRISRKNAPLSLAIAFANIVFPQPGGP